MSVLAALFLAQWMTAAADTPGTCCDDDYNVGITNKSGQIWQAAWLLITG